MTTNSTDEPVTCTVCGGYDDEDHKIRQHPFTTPDQPEWVPPKDKPTKAEQRRDKGNLAPPRLAIMPAPDLALRAVLINKGIVTNEELKEAENALRFPGHSDPFPPDRGDAG